jgi:hypothetical protein
MTALEGLRLLTAWVFFLKNLEIYNWWYIGLGVTLRFIEPFIFTPFLIKQKSNKCRIKIPK